MSDQFWQSCPRADGRMEWTCPHGVGHGEHDHGCDGCCSRDDYPGPWKQVRLWWRVVGGTLYEANAYIPQGVSSDRAKKRTQNYASLGAAIIQQSPSTSGAIIQGQYKETPDA